MCKLWMLCASRLHPGCFCRRKSCPASESLSINPNTIQRSYRQLEMEGWIATVPGKGCFVCGIPEGDPQEELRLLRQFDDSARNLLLRGYTRQELIKRLEQEENHA